MERPAATAAVRPSAGDARQAPQVDGRGTSRSPREPERPTKTVPPTSPEGRLPVSTPAAEPAPSASPLGPRSDAAQPAQKIDPTSSATAVLRSSAESSAARGLPANMLEFQVKITKQTGWSLGLDLAADKQGNLVVSGIKDAGLISEWNKQHVTSQVRPRDFVIGVGMEKASAGASMLDALKSQLRSTTVAEIEILFGRSDQTLDNVGSRGSLATASSSVNVSQDTLLRKPGSSSSDSLRPPLPSKRAAAVAGTISSQASPTAARTLQPEQQRSSAPDAVASQASQQRASQSGKAPVQTKPAVQLPAAAEPTEVQFSASVKSTGFGGLAARFRGSGKRK